MIFIVDHTFKVSHTKPNFRSGSIQEQLARKNTFVPETKSSLIDNFFALGETYRVRYISYSKNSIKYIFENVVTHETVEKFFNSSGDGDVYIASLSGTIEELNDYKESINNTFKNS